MSNTDRPLGAPPPTPSFSDDIVSPSAAGPMRLEQQEINGVLIHHKWEVWRDGVYRRKVFLVTADEGTPPCPSPHESAPIKYALAHLERVTGRPAYLSGIGHRIDDSRELLGLTFLAGSEPEESEKTVEERDAAAKSSGKLPGEQWKTVWVKHDVIADAHKILELSVDVFPVRTSSAKSMSDFLTDCYDANMGSMKSTIVRRSGYHCVDGKHGWLIGQRWIGHGKVTALPPEHGLQRALCTHGSEEEWLRWVQEAWNFSESAWIIRWMLAVTMASPLLRHVGERTFLCHHYTQSGGSKSLLARIGQSAWGNPKENFLSINRATQNSLLEIFKYVSDIPVLLDEMQGRENDISAFAMQACQETHKERTKQDGGLREIEAKSWRLIIRTTGEQTLAGADQTDLGGQQGRVLEIRHPGLQIEHAEKLFRTLDDPHHYGYAGLRFLQQLAPVVNDGDRLTKLRERFQETMALMVEHTGRRSAVERQMAAIALGEALMLRWVFGYEAELAGKVALRDGLDILDNWIRVKEGSPALWGRALEFLVEHRHACAHMYADVSLENGKQKLVSWGSKTSAPIIGAINAGPTQSEIWYFPNAVNKLLKEHYGTAERIWEEFAQEGILDRGSDRLARQRQIKGVLANTKVYVVRKDKLFAYEPEPIKVDIAEMQSYVPVDDYDYDMWYDDSAST